MADFKTDNPGFTQSGSASSDSVVDSAKQAASQVLDDVRDQATTRADQKREFVAEGVSSVAHAFRQMGDGARNSGPFGAYTAEFGHKVADRVEQTAQYLRTRDVRGIVNDAENYARRSPAVFLGGAFLLGIAVSRFLKSSRPPDAFANMPDPSRALPPASYPLAGPQGNTGFYGSTGYSAAAITSPGRPRHARDHRAFRPGKRTSRPPHPAHAHGRRGAIAIFLAANRVFRLAQRKTEVIDA